MTDSIKLTPKDIALNPSAPSFKRLTGILSPPLEISRARLPGLNMVDETIVVRSKLHSRKGDKR